MEEILGLVLKALLGVAGPVGRYVRKRGSEGVVAELYKQSSPESAPGQAAAAAVTKRLSQRGLKQHELIAVSKFVRSDAGAVLAQSAVVFALQHSRLAGIPGFKAGLYAQGAALARLHARGPVEWANDAAEVLVDEIVALVHPVMQKIRNRNPQLAEDLSASADLLSDQREWSDTKEAARRATQINKLAGMLPTDLESQIVQYCNAMARQTELLSVPTVQETHYMPILEGLVTPELVQETDRGLVVRTTGSHRNPIIELLTQTNSMVVLGDPGAGKSTMVQAAIHELASAIGAPEPAPVPVLVTLRDYANALETNQNLLLIDFIASTASSDLIVDFDPETIRYLLDTGRCVVFFDGLDEVLAIERKRTVAKRVNALVSRFVNGAFVLTARSIGYEQVPVTSIVETLLIEPFDDDRVRAYVERFISLAVRGGAGGPGVDVENFMRESVHIGDIRSNPLLLGVLCSLYTSGRTMPTDRVELYRKCAEMLFDEWDAGRGIVIPVADKYATEQAVRGLALKVFQSGREEISEDDLENFLTEFRQEEAAVGELEARDFARTVMSLWRGRKWVLIPAGTRHRLPHVRFAHRTFLEFFAAEQTVYDRENGVELWNAIAPFVERRAASSYCLLSLQIGSRRGRSFAENFFDTALAAATDAGLASGEALSIALFCSEGLVSDVRCRVPVRMSVIPFAADVFSRLIPRVEPPVAGGMSSALENLCVSFIPLEIDANELTDGESDDDEFDAEFYVQTVAQYDPDKDEDLGVVIEEASIVIANLQHLQTAEWPAAIEELRTFSLRLLEDSTTLARGVRFAMTLQQLPHTPRWATVSEGWSKEIETLTLEMWQRITQLRVELEEPRDFWIAHQLIRSRATDSTIYTEWIGLDGLFVGGWSLSAYGPNHGTPAHSLVLALLGVELDIYGAEWTDQAITGFADWIARPFNEAIVSVDEAPARTDATSIETRAHQLGRLGMDIGGQFDSALFQELGLIDALGARPSARAINPAANDLTAIAFLLGKFVALGDSKFVESVAHFVAPELAQMINAYLDSIAESDSVDSSIAAIEHLRVSEDLGSVIGGSVWGGTIP